MKGPPALRQEGCGGLAQRGEGSRKEGRLSCSAVLCSFSTGRGTFGSLFFFLPLLSSYLHLFLCPRFGRSLIFDPFHFELNLSRKLNNSPTSILVSASKATAIPSSSDLFTCGEADRSRHGKCCSSCCCCCCWGDHFHFTSLMYTQKGCEKKQTLSKNRCEKGKLF